MLTPRAPLAAFALPRAERTGARVAYRDALVAPLPGYRPLLLDLVVPAGTPAAVVVVLDGGALAAWGHSAGGYLAAILAVTADLADFEGDLGVTGPSSGLAAAVAWSPPTDFTRIPPPPAGTSLHRTGHDPHDWLPGATASPLLHVSATAAPLQLVHGTDDSGIPIAHSEALVSAYWRAGADADLIRLDGAGHFYSRQKLRQVTESGVAFLRERLG